MQLKRDLDNLNIQQILYAGTVKSGDLDEYVAVINGRVGFLNAQNRTVHACFCTCGNAFNGVFYSLASSIFRIEGELITHIGVITGDSKGDLRFEAGDFNEFLFGLTFYPRIIQNGVGVVTDGGLRQIVAAEIECIQIG